MQRMHRERADRGRVGQAGLDRLPIVAAIGETVEAGVNFPSASGLAGEAQVDEGAVVVRDAARHWIALRSAVAGASQGLRTGRKARLSCRWTGTPIHRIGTAVATRARALALQVIVAAAIVIRLGACAVSARADDVQAALWDAQQSELC